jgi:ferredoxin-NADP reductase
MQALLYVLAGASLAGTFALLAMTTNVWLLRAKCRWKRYRRRTFRLQVSRRRNFTDNLFELELTHPDSRSLRGFLPGQFISLQGPLLPSGVAIERRYSLASWVAKPGTYRLCIKREPHGKLSNWLFDLATPGTALSVRPPDGEFHLKKRNLSSPCIVLVAAGVGITPLKAMLEWLSHNRYPGDVYLFYTARQTAELLYHAEFLALAEQWPNFQYLSFLTGSDPASTVPGLHYGRISAELLFQKGGTTADYYFCASQQMIDSLHASLQDLGVNASQLHYELFTVGGRGCGSHEVTCEGKTINAEGFPTLLQVLEALEIPIDTDCCAGTCGRCRVSLTSGKVKHTIPISPNITIGPDHYLACCAVPESAVTIKLP